jgi:hypothetical protein
VERSNSFYVFAAIAFRATVPGAKYCEADGVETEVWRAGQRFSTADRWRKDCFPLPGDFGARPGVSCLLAHEILTNALNPLQCSSGVKLLSLDHVAAIRNQVTDDKTRPRLLTDEPLSGGRR